MRRRLLGMIRPLVLLGGFSLLAALFAHLGPDRIVTLFLSLGSNLLEVLSLFVAHECVRAMAVQRCLPSDPPLPFAAILRIRFLGELAGSLTRTGPFAAEPARAWLLAGTSQSGAAGYAAAIAELMINSATSAAVNIAVIGWVMSTRDLAGPLRILSHVLFWGSLVYASGIVAAVTLRARFLHAVSRFAGRLPLIGRRLGLDAVKVQDIQDAVDAVLGRRRTDVARVLLLEITAQAVLLSEVYWTIRSMGVAVPLQTAVLFEVMTRAVDVVQFVGVTEAGYAMVFTWLGMPAAVGFTLSFVRTVRSLIASSLGAGLLTGAERLTALRASRFADRSEVVDTINEYSG
jgi:hypothetical protein